MVVEQAEPRRVERACWDQVRPGACVWGRSIHVVCGCGVGFGCRQVERAPCRALPSSSICIMLIWNLDLKSSRKEAEAAEEEEEEDLTYSVVGTSARSLISRVIEAMVSELACRA